MRQRERKQIFRLIARKMYEGKSLGLIVDTLCVAFDLSIPGAEDAIQQWMEQREQEDGKAA